MGRSGQNEGRGGVYIPGLNIKLTAPYGLAILRIVLGIAMAVHGWSKLSGGVDGVAGFFGSLGIPLPGLTAWLVTIIELGGGILLIVGAATQVVSILIALDMLGAILFVKIRNPFFTENGIISWELEAIFLAAALCLFLSGPGAWSVDDVVIDTRRT